jgi:glycosyltransferase involved in cell wall biosynthesis
VIASPESDDLWVVIAAYNEARMIGSVVRGVRAHYGNIVVVDDGSADATAEEALAAGATVLSHPINLGQGAALQTGLAYAYGQRATRIVTFDADGQHAIEDVAVMLAIQDRLGVDVVLGSRFLGRTVNMPRSKHLTLKAAVLFTKLTTGMRLTDAHNGLRLLNRNAAGKIRLRQNRMAHASEFLSQVRHLHLTYAEAPVTISYSQYSVAKGQRLSNAFNIVLELIFGRLGR